MVADSCDQDMRDALCVIKATIQKYQKIWPSIRKVITKMDNAGCYAGL